MGCCYHRYNRESHQYQQRKLKNGIHGVILSRGWQRATFLPQVWEQLPDTEDFLGHLCEKAGMEKTCWMDKKTSVKVYEAEYFSENLEPSA